jgi:hypothetical protein
MNRHFVFYDREQDKYLVFHKADAIAAYDTRRKAEAAIEDLEKPLEGYPDVQEC